MVDKEKQAERQRRYREKRKANSVLHQLDNERARERVKEYRVRHKLVTFGVKIPKEVYDKAKEKLEQRGITVYRFVTDAINNLLEE